MVRFPVPALAVKDDNPNHILLLLVEILRLIAPFVALVSNERFPPHPALRIPSPVIVMLLAVILVSLTTSKPAPKMGDPADDAVKITLPL